DRNRCDAIAATGEVRIDSFHIDDLQITQLRGPYQIRDDRLRLGAVAGDGVTPIPIEGRLFDGTMRVDGDVVLSDASFNVRLALIGAQMPVLLADLGHGDNDLTGTLTADMSLEGLLGTRDLLRGEGQAAIKDANLYQLPVLVQLLNVLSISPTEDAAFTNAELQFDLNEDQFQFNKLSLWGSLIALHGHGTLDRRHELDLTFNTAVSPRNLFTRVFRQLKDDRYTLLTVDVTGPLENPAIQRRALDNVGQTLERILPGMNNGAESNRKDRSAGIGRMFQ
ncbi:MAG: hypothetical protein AAFN70_16665, partial [Planctomycetota bacterium]